MGAMQVAQPVQAAGGTLLYVVRLTGNEGIALAASGRIRARLARILGGCLATHRAPDNFADPRTRLPGRVWQLLFNRFQTGSRAHSVSELISSPIRTPNTPCRIAHISWKLRCPRSSAL